MVLATSRHPPKPPTILHRNRRSDGPPRQPRNPGLSNRHDTAPSHSRPNERWTPCQPLYTSSHPTCHPTPYSTQTNQPSVQNPNCITTHPAINQHPPSRQSPHQDTLLQTTRHQRSISSNTRDHGPRKPTPPIFPTDNDSQPSNRDIMRSYSIDTLFASEYYTGDTKEIETAEANRAPDRELFILAIQKEVHSLITETKNLHPLTKTATGYAENSEQKRIWKIRTTLKCKRKNKPNGEPDKHKARAAARGDTLRRAMIKAQVPPPVSYSPTIMLTFSLFLQLAVIRKLHMATMDIKSVYLNALLPTTPDWIVTTLEPHIAEVYGLDPAQEYRIANALYGLPDSGRLFYQHYKAALLAGGCQMSAFDKCLFYRRNRNRNHLHNCLRR